MKKSASSARAKQPVRSAKLTKRSKGADEPSPESLREIPPMEPGTYTVFKGPGALDRALTAARAMGRPKKGSTAVGTAAKSLRLAKDEWAALATLAEARRTTLHALMREAVLNALHLGVKSKGRVEKNRSRDVVGAERSRSTARSKRTAGARS